MPRGSSTTLPGCRGTGAPPTVATPSPSNDDHHLGQLLLNVRAHAGGRFQLTRHDRAERRLGRGATQVPHQHRSRAAEQAFAAFVGFVSVPHRPFDQVRFACERSHRISLSLLFAIFFSVRSQILR